MTSISKTWGTSPEERRLVYACDRLTVKPDLVLYRGVTIHAPAKIIFRWLCQMRVAPYSYDWIDNRGKQSPQQLSPGLEQLAVGQDVMRIFDLVDFERNRHLTIRIKPGSRALRTFGDLALSYTIVPSLQSASVQTCRLLVKLVGKTPPGLLGRLRSSLLPWGDFFMMRRQLLNFKLLAEKSRDS
jgi:hypothetical protein